ncbi:hypothetical protein FVE85_8302 [Porphyridium purpureum]|uniref:C2H2-type domain-containing protein n=1 Tax=Porphyridium purpureum TaxID=35688 RepID=A0A5J4YLN8_PORPP|nr:hypothetical protein FVE85_8302 [Porphyridium purpureum]|eukprot:POR3184..scf244_11
MDIGLVSGAQYGFLRLRSCFQQFLPDFKTYLRLQRARRLDNPQGAPFASELRLMRVLTPLWNDQILRNLMVPGNISLVQVGHVSSGQPILSVMSQTCLAHYEFQTLALDDDLRVLNALCVVIRSSLQEIELLEVAEVSHAYVLVSLVSFHKTKARTGSSLLLDCTSGLDDPRLFDRVKGALTFEAYPTDPAAAPLSHEQFDPLFSADWDFWCLQLPKWGITKCMTRIEILSRFGLVDYEKAAIWFLADYLYLQPAPTAAPLGHLQQQPLYASLQQPQQHALERQHYSPFYLVVAPSYTPLESGAGIGTGLGAPPPGLGRNGLGPYAPVSPASAPLLAHTMGGIQSASDIWIHRSLAAGAATRPHLATGPTVDFVPQGQLSLLQDQQSGAGSPSSPTSSHGRSGRPLLRFRCPECSAMFSRNSNLARHVQVCHESIRRHVCNICQWAFAQRSDLKKHVKRKHPHRFDGMFGPADAKSNDEVPSEETGHLKERLDAGPPPSQPNTLNAETGRSVPKSTSGPSATNAAPGQISADSLSRPNPPRSTLGPGATNSASGPTAADSFSGPNPPCSTSGPRAPSLAPCSSAPKLTAPGPNAPNSAPALIGAKSSPEQPVPSASRSASAQETLDSAKGLSHPP